MKKYTFLKNTSGEWFVELPDWPGSKEDLEMVCGADDLLNVFDEGYGIVNLMLSTEEFEDSMKLMLTETDGNSGTYNFNNRNINLDLWLCPVLKFVFGTIPDNIHFKPC